MEIEKENSADILNRRIKVNDDVIDTGGNGMEPNAGYENIDMSVVGNGNFSAES